MPNTKDISVLVRKMGVALTLTQWNKARSSGWKAENA